MKFRPSILAAAALTAGLLTFGAVGSPAFAREVPSIRVSHADLDLATSVGRDTLDRRIAGAAGQLCGSFSPIELTWAAAVRACQAETIADALPQRDAALRRGTVQVSSADRFVRVSRAAN